GFERPGPLAEADGPGRAGHLVLRQRPKISEVALAPPTAARPADRNAGRRPDLRPRPLPRRQHNAALRNHDDRGASAGDGVLAVATAGGPDSDLLHLRLHGGVRHYLIQCPRARHPRGGWPCRTKLCCLRFVTTLLTSP